MLLGYKLVPFKLKSFASCPQKFITNMTGKINFVMIFYNSYMMKYLCSNVDCSF